MEFAIINFRVTPTERQRLRVALLQEGVTMQEFFADVVQEKLQGQFPGHDGTPACPSAAASGEE